LIDAAVAARRSLEAPLRVTRSLPMNRRRARGANDHQNPPEQLT